MGGFEEMVLCSILHRSGMEAKMNDTIYSI